MKKEIVIIGEGFGFPNGAVATTRVRNIAIGLTSSGWDVSIAIPIGTESESNPHNTRTHGILNRIKFYYLGGTTIRSGNWFKRRIEDIRGKIELERFLKKRHEKHRIDIVLLYSRNHMVSQKTLKVCRKLNIPIVLEACEWLPSLAKQGICTEKRAIKYSQDIVSNVDAIIPISQLIEQEAFDIFQKIGKNIPSLRLPILINEDDYCKSATINEQIEPYILYAGGFAYYDIMLIVLETMKELKRNGIAIPLKITGNDRAKQVKDIKEYAQKNGLESQIQFTGFLSDDELRKQMSNAAILIAPIPENEQSKSRFPTKFAYYLASGAPVVTNGYGEINKYLIDNENSFLSKSCAPIHLSQAIIRAMNSPHKREIGNAGKQMALHEFGCHSQCKRLSAFLTEILK